MNVSGVATEFELFPNVIHEVHGHDWSCILEARYMREFLANIRGGAPEIFHSHRFLIMNRNSRWTQIDPPDSGDDVVLIWLGDEEGTVPHELSRKFRLILKSYWPLSEAVGNMHPFPLCGSSAVLEKDTVPFEERKTGVFFSGNLNANRVDFYRQFIPWGGFPPGNLPLLARKLIARGLGTRLGRILPRDFSASFPDSEISFTGGFAQGYPRGEFATRLADSKIAICPPGFTSHETIRHFEAMSHGCVVISSPLPPNPFYRGSPVIELKNWQLLHQLILNLIEDPESLGEISRLTRSWWRNHCSPEALAQKITPVLKKQSR
jgi:hypothetical protein